ncbi:MAG: phytanoyl-CoA dioxygenase family protein [Pseudomonadota bacterium]
MRQEEIRAYAPNVITSPQREQYFADGYLHLPDFLPAEWLDRLRQATRELLDKSRAVSASNESFDVGDAHSAAAPDVRRIRAAVDRHPDYWAFAAGSVITELAADLVGPDVKFHSAKLNFKSAGKTSAIKWHQDIQAWPHTNYSPVTIGVYLDDVSLADGPLQVVPGSHDGELFDQFDGERWTGSLAADDVARLELGQAVDLTGPAGTVFAINCRTVHGSPPSQAASARPCLLNVFSSADAFTYTAAPTPTSHTGEIVRGQPAKWAHHDPRPCRLPPDWSRTGYGSIFTAQADRSQGQSG